MFNRFLRWVMLPMLVALGSCMVVVSPPPTYTQTEIYAPVVEASPEIDDRDCGVFKMPAFAPTPAIPNLRDSIYVTVSDVEVALAAHIKELRDFIDQEKKRLERAYGAYIQSCKS